MALTITEEETRLVDAARTDDVLKDRRGALLFLMPTAGTITCNR